MKVVVSPPMHDEERARLRAAGIQVIGPPTDEPARLEQLVSALRGGETLLTQLTNVVNAAMVGNGAAPLVAIIAVGYDNIDLAAAVRHGLMVTNAPDILTRGDRRLHLGAAARYGPPPARSRRADPFGRIGWIAVAAGVDGNRCLWSSAWNRRCGSNRTGGGSQSNARVRR